MQPAEILRRIHPEDIRYHEATSRFHKYPMHVINATWASIDTQCFVHGEQCDIRKDISTWLS
jgi:hypothetical protein